MNETAEKLKILLASTFALYLKTSYMHWNVIGPNFPQYHKLLEKQYSEIYEQVDVIAEKIRTLNHFAPGSFERFSTLSIIEGFLQPKLPLEMFGVLLSDHENMRTLLKDIYATAESEQNFDVSNYIAERMDQHAKHAWMIRSILAPIQ